MGRKRKLIFFRHYFSAFFEPLEEGLKKKIDYVLYLAVSAERIPMKFFRAIAGSDGLFEIRIEYQSNTYKIFCCFDESNLIVLFNGFQKKTLKTPKQEIQKAQKIKDAYFRLKRKDDE